MMPCRKKIHDHSRCDQRGAEPQRHPVSLDRRNVLDELELRQEEAEPRDNKTKSRQRQPGANPHKKGSLGGQIVAECRLTAWFSDADPFCCFLLQDILYRRHLKKVVTSEPSDIRARSAMCRKRPCSTPPLYSEWMRPGHRDPGFRRTRNPESYSPSSVMNSEPVLNLLIVEGIPMLSSFLVTTGHAMGITSDRQWKLSEPGDNLTGVGNYDESL